MESPESTVTTVQPVSSKFSSVFKTAYGIYKKNPWIFIKLYLLPIICALLLEIGIFSLLMLPRFFNQQLSQLNQTWAIVVFCTVFLVVIILISLIQFIAKNACFRAAYVADNNQEVRFGESMKVSWSKLGKAIGLGFRIFLYTGLWIMIAILLVFAITNYSMQFAPDVTQKLTAIWVVLPIVALVALIFIISRILQVTFAFPILMSKDVTSKEAMAESIALAEGKTGRIFINYLLFGIVIALFQSIFNQVITQVIGLFIPAAQGSRAVFENATNTAIIAALVSNIPALVVGSFSVVFQYAFARNMQVEKAAAAKQSLTGYPA